jgi:hypothetical protein
MPSFKNYPHSPPNLNFAWKRESMSIKSWISTLHVLVTSLSVAKGKCIGSCNENIKGYKLQV